MGEKLFGGVRNKDLGSLRSRVVEYGHLIVATRRRVTQWLGHMYRRPTSNDRAHCVCDAEAAKERVGEAATDLVCAQKWEKPQDRHLISQKPAKKSWDFTWFRHNADLDRGFERSVFSRPSENALLLQRSLDRELRLERARAP
jgi:hypothetical protein